MGGAGILTRKGEGEREDREDQCERRGAVRSSWT